MRVDRFRLMVFRIGLALFMLHWSLVTGHWSGAFAQTPKPVAQESLATDQTISLDLKGVDILDVLKLLSQKSGINFVAGRNVTGRVTIFAKDVDVWGAFERIVEANDLAYERKANIINVMTARDYELLYGEKFQERKESRVIALKYAKAPQVATVLNQIKSNLGRVVVDEASNTIILNDAPAKLEEMARVLSKVDLPTETRLYSLNYAEAEKLKEKIQELLTPGLGTFTFDARTNRVVITDLKSPLAKIDAIIRAFDQQEGEVLIEAKIVKVKLTEDESLGIDWQQVFGGVDTKVRANFDVLGDIADGTATGGALKFLTAPSGNTQIIIEALKKFGKIETVANPRIAVSNNQEAKILVGKKDVIVKVTTQVPATGSTVSSPDIEFVDVGTKLFVTPSIKRDGHIQLKIRPEVSTSETVTPIAGVVSVPIVTTTEAETNVLVKSGTTLVIGGLIDTKIESKKNQVPMLGSIPLVGVAFRSRVDTSEKTEIVVFLTPQIISATGERITEFPSAVSVERIAEAVTAEAPVPVSYQRRVRQILNEKLAQRLRAASLGEGSLVVSFILSRDGHVIGSPTITSLQGELFVTAARQALEAATPFPPFPEGVEAQEVRFRLAVDHRPKSP